MEFYFESCIVVSEYDLDEMVNRVKNGEDFDEVYDDISASWGDYEYYSSGLIEEEVEKEVIRRIKEN